MISIDELYVLFRQHRIVTTDSRKIEPGSIFFALKGEKFDGNDYALAALAAGAAYAVVDRTDLAERHNGCLPVPNVLQALQELACHHRRQLGIPLIAVTGTNGKTTTKELIAAVLKKKYNLLYTQGNLNNHIGVPLTLLQMQEEHQLALVEMGASKPGDIKELAEIAEPNFGLITNIGKAHLAGFGSLDGVRKTKGELYDYLKVHEGVVFVNTDDRILTGMCDGMSVIGYGTDPGCSVCGKLRTEHSDVFCSFFWKSRIEPEAKEHFVNTRLIGAYNLPNALAAVMVGFFFDVPSEDIDRALEEYIPNNSRSQLIQTSSNSLIVDAYNANPTSMEVALRNFHAIKDNRLKVLILGDMLELGDESSDAHAQILSVIRELGPWQRVVLVGQEFLRLQTGKDGFLYFSSIQELKEYLTRNPVTDSLILLKGSHGIHLQEIPDLC